MRINKESLFMESNCVEEKRRRLVIALEKLRELRAADLLGDPLAQERAAATYLTVTVGISRPLSDRYVAQISDLVNAGTQGSAESLITDAMIPKICNLDDKFGAAFMVLPHHVEQILKGGKHMSRRFRRWGDEGDVFHVKGKAFKFTRVAQLRVGDITDDDILKEGYASREEFEQMWVKTHPKSVAAGIKLEPNQFCWCHEYEAV
jgi:hypothetical protein